MSDQKREHARSFGAVAEAYDRARPSYPAEAFDWLVGAPGGDPLRILELGAGTGKFTRLIIEAGHRVIATDPSAEMLEHLARRVPDAHPLVASADSIPLPSRSVDLVVCAQSFHWFDDDASLAEIARVLRPGGTLALVWNSRDEAIPWVRRLGRLIRSGGVGGERDASSDLAGPLRDCAWFDDVAEREYRFWQDLRRPELFDLVRSRSYIAVMDDAERDEVLDRVGALYDDYGRGPDGMKLPYLTRCYKTTVIRQPPPPVVMSRIEDEAISLVGEDLVGEELVGEEPDASAPTASADPDATQAIPREPSSSGPEDTGTLLIDFR